VTLEVLGMPGATLVGFGCERCVGAVPLWKRCLVGESLSVGVFCFDFCFDFDSSSGV